MSPIGLSPRAWARRLRTLACAAAAGCVALAGSSAWAADLASVAPAFGNTVISRYPDGTSQKIWLHPDGSWTGISRKGGHLAGRWSVRDDKVCLRQSSPPTLPISYCTPFPASSAPGVQWAGHDVAGRPITLSLMKGVPSEYQGAARSSR